MATNEQLDSIADRLGALYQVAALSNLVPTALDEMVSIISDLEMASGRAKRARDIRKMARRRERDLQKSASQ